MQSTLAPLLGLPPERVRVISPHVGGGFGSKGAPHAHVVLAALAAQAVPDRAIKFALTHYRGQMSEMARRLGIGRSTLYRKMKEYGLNDPAMDANEDAA